MKKFITVGVAVGLMGSCGCGHSAGGGNPTGGDSLRPYEARVYEVAGL